METIYSPLQKYAESDPTKIAIITKDGHFTYKFIHELSERLAKKLIDDYGVCPGDRIALFIPDKIFFVIAYYAIVKAHATVIPIDHLLKNNEVQYILNHSQARFLLVNRSTELRLLSDSQRHFVPLQLDDSSLFSYYALYELDHREWDENVARMDSDVASITYTSGTTGIPKGVVITHRSIIEKMHAFNDVLNISKDDRILSELSLVYIYGQVMVMNLGLWHGCTLILLDGDRIEDILSYLENEKVTMMFSIPLTYTKMNDYVKENNVAVKHHLRFAITGGNILTSDRKKEIEKNLNVKLLDSYGLTETTASVIMEYPNLKRKIGSIGKVISGSSVQLWDENGRELAPGQIGEIVVKTTGMMSGYFRDDFTQSASFTDGWFHTGDLGYQDIEGYFFIVDRRKDMIKTLGFAVSPSEVEGVLLSHHGVQDAAVIGVQDEKCDEIIKAYIVPKPNVTLKQADLHHYISNYLASYKCPAIYEFVEKLPRNNSGKLLKTLLK